MLEYLIIGGLLAGAGWLYSQGKIPGLNAKAAPPPQPPAPPGAPAIPGFPGGATIVTPDGHGTGVVVGPPLPTLPPVPPGTLPSLPPLGSVAGQLGQLGQLIPKDVADANLGKLIPKDILDTILPGDKSAIVKGDVINVDMFRSGMAIPQNVPVVGLIFMRVVDMNVPGDIIPPKKLLAEFVSPEFMILGQQNINRDSIVEKVS